MMIASGILVVPIAVTLVGLEEGCKEAGSDEYADGLGALVDDGIGGDHLGVEEGFVGDEVHVVSEVHHGCKGRGEIRTVGRDD